MTQSDTELTLQVARTFEVSREQVFAAWTDPESVRRWFGPREFSNPSAELDVRVAAPTGSPCEVPTVRRFMRWHLSRGQPAVAVGVLLGLGSFPRLRRVNCDRRILRA